MKTRIELEEQTGRIGRECKEWGVACSRSLSTRDQLIMEEFAARGAQQMLRYLREQKILPEISR